MRPKKLHVLKDGSAGQLIEFWFHFEQLGKKFSA